MKEIKCDGECSREGECKGVVRPVIVTRVFADEKWHFNYCETAIEVDQKNGFSVEDESEVLTEQK